MIGRSLFTRGLPAAAILVMGAHAAVAQAAAPASVPPPAPYSLPWQLRPVVTDENYEMIQLDLPLAF